jgi:hypothetical protein
MKFELTEDQLLKVRAWCEEQDKIVVERQRASKPRDVFTTALAEEGIAYYGAVGGELTYMFTPNSIGEVVVVKYSVTGAELDISDYNW